MKKLSEKLERVLDVKLDDKTRARLDRFEETAVEYGALKTEILDSLLEGINDFLDKAEEKFNRN